MDSFVRASIGPLRDSAYFMIIASNTYVRSLGDPHDSEHLMLLSQVLAAKADNKPVIVMWIKSISDLNKTKLREVLKDMNVLGEIEAKGEGPVDAEIEQIMELISEYEERLEK